MNLQQYTTHLKRFLILMQPQKTRSFMGSVVLILMAMLTFNACSSPKTSDLDTLRSELDKKQGELRKLQAEIDSISFKIEAIDTASRDNAIPVYAERVAGESFKNPFVMQGLIESDQNVLVTAEMPGKIQRIHVREGQRVSRGQVIATLDAGVVEAQIAELKSAMSLAEVNYQKQKTLWDQKIGSEMMFLQAKNQYENLQKSLETANRQLAKFTLRSPISGTVDEIMANEGELTGTMTGGPVARVVNPGDIKIKVSVSERYVGTMKVGQPVNVSIPSLDLTFTDKIEAVGNVIDVNNRTFSVYVKPHAHMNVLKPNMLAMVTAYDYQSDDAIVVPTKLIRKSGEQHFVLVIKENGSRLTVEKRPIEIERQFASSTIIKSGLAPSDYIITAGYNGLVEGDQVRIVEENKGDNQ